MPSMAARPTTRDWFLFGLISFFWGSSYLFIKIGVETMPPMTLIAGRLFFGSLVLGAALLIVRSPLPRERSTYAKLVFMALVNIVIPFTLITWGEQYIDSSLAAILQATTPLFTIVIASLALSEEAITLNRLVGLILGFGGVVVLFSHGLGSGSGIELAAGRDRARPVVAVVRHRRRVRPGQHARPPPDGPGLLPGLDRAGHHRRVWRSSSSRRSSCRTRRPSCSPSCGSASSARRWPT